MFSDSFNFAKQWGMNHGCSQIPSSFKLLSSYLTAQHNWGKTYSVCWLSQNMISVKILAWSVIFDWFSYSLQGILSSVYLDGRVLRGWKMYLLPLTNLNENPKVNPIIQATESGFITMSTRKKLKPKSGMLLTMLSVFFQWCKAATLLRSPSWSREKKNYIDFLLQQMLELNQHSMLESFLSANKTK